MSWGERSCKLYQGKEPCPYNPTVVTCTDSCTHYQWDGKSKTEFEIFMERDEAKRNKKRIYDEIAEDYEIRKYSCMTANQKKAIRKKLKRR